MSKGSTASSPVPGSTSENAGGEMMRRTGSGGAGQPAFPSSVHSLIVSRAPGIIRVIIKERFSITKE